MKRYFIPVITVILGFFIVAFQPSGSKNIQPGREVAIINSTLAYLDRMHFDPRPIDDEFSKEAFNNYLSSIDGGKRLFIQKEVDELKKYELEIDDLLKISSMEFFELSLERLSGSLDRAERFYSEIINQSEFDFTVDEIIELDYDKRSFSQSEEELKKYWYKLLKYEVLSRYTNEKSKQEDFNDEAELKSDVELYGKACDDVKKNFDRWFKRMKTLKREDQFSLYLNAITQTFDPHTNYFTPKNKDDFNTSMSGIITGIGATLRTEEDYTKVMSIVVGGPAWKNKELEVNDLILKVKQDGEEPVDIMGMMIDEVVGMIRGKKETTVTLTIRKVDGTVKDISIVRDEVIIDESFVKSVIIDVPGVLDRVGYIRLPKFYADFERPDGASSADDMAKEIEKLKNANVSGIILDLRNNGGGSLRDVVQMSGLFIESGPIVQVKDRDRAPYSLNDRDSDVQYDGPLVVMVNAFSASASEILAAAMQDYDRAVIVGSKSTFGKGTVQRFLGIDGKIVGRAGEQLGDIKLTTQKFYRVNGGSTQLEGVKPDILLPDTYMYLDVGEREYEKPMPWTKVNPVDFNQNVYRVGNKSGLKRMSENRVKKHEVFTKIEENARRLKEESDNSVYSLNYDKYYTELKASEERSKQYKDLFIENESIVIVNPVEDFDYIQMDSSRIVRNNDWFESIRKDIYIEETVNIMRDMIESQKKVSRND